MENKEKTTMNKSEKGKKILDILSLVICVLVVIVAINGIVSRSRGYSSFFGSGIYAVESDSMDGGREDSFKKGDIIIIDVLNEKDRAEIIEKDLDNTTIKVGSIITFRTIKEGKKVLNSHRVIKVFNNGDGLRFQTQGDNPKATVDAATLKVVDVVGVYTGKIPAVGNVVLFAQSFWGIFVFIVLPSLLVLAYAIYQFVVTFKIYNSEKMAVDKEAMEQEIREKLKKEMELEAQKTADTSNANNDNTSSNENK